MTKLYRSLFSAMSLTFCVLLASCSAMESSSAPKSAASSEAETSQSAQMTSTTEKVAKPKSVAYENPVDLDSYQILCQSAQAENTVSCKKADFPQQINEKQFSVMGFLNETTLLISLHIDDENDEIGLLPLNQGNIETAQYQKLTAIKENQSVTAWNEDYLVIYDMESTDGWFTLSNRDYYLFDIRNRRLGTKFWSSSKDENGMLAEGGSTNTPLIYENTLYFDDFSINDGELTVTLYAYDITQKRITKQYPECQKPMLMQDTVLAITQNQDRKYRKLISLADQGEAFSCEYGENLMALEVGCGELYAITSEGIDNTTQLSVTKLQNLTTGIGIAMGNTVFSDLKTGDVFAVWSNYTANTAVKPAVYDMKSKQLLTVGKQEELPKNVQFYGYTMGKTALLIVTDWDHSENQCYILQM